MLSSSFGLEIQSGSRCATSSWWAVRRAVVQRPRPSRLAYGGQLCGLQVVDDFGKWAGSQSFACTKWSPNEAAHSTDRDERFSDRGFRIRVPHQQIEPRIALVQGGRIAEHYLP